MTISLEGNQFDTIKSETYSYVCAYTEFKIPCQNAMGQRSNLRSDLSLQLFFGHSDLRLV